MLGISDLSNRIKVAGFGNPLLDISVVLKGCALELLEKHSLQLDGQEEVDDVKFKDILNTLKM